LTVKVALVAPAEQSTLEGTLAAVLSLDSGTCAPPAGAGPLNVTVPVEDCAPPVTVVGFKVNEEREGAGGGAGVTVSEAVLVMPAWDAETVTSVDVATALVLTVKVALVAPAETVTVEDTLAGRCVVAGKCDLYATCGSRPAQVTVPVEEFPPVTLRGVQSHRGKREGCRR